MGKGTAEVERELKEQRDAIAYRFERLRGRLADDAQTAKDELAGRARAAGERMDGMAGPESLRPATRKRPWQRRWLPAWRSVSPVVATTHAATAATAGPRRSCGHYQAARDAVAGPVPKLAKRGASAGWNGVSGEVAQVVPRLPRGGAGSKPPGVARPGAGDGRGHGGRPPALELRRRLPPIMPARDKLSYDLDEPARERTGQ